jgi:homoserine O-succinyltransferase/O-acetyltransferase
MPLIAHTELPTFTRLKSEGQEVLSIDRAAQQDIRELHLGLLNMMPDAALQATERQFLRLIGACNRIVQVYVHVFTMPGIPREGEAARYVDDHYESFEDIKAQGLDALVITGANPVCPDIRDEPYWLDLLSVMDWADANVTSTLCSCLASHARFAQAYGVERTPLATKQWGVYSHRVLNTNHPLTGNLNSRFDAPHSRWNNVPREELEAVGIHVLAHSEVAGVHLAVSPDGFRWLYLQGHPEYDILSLPKEYKREVTRYQEGINATYPPYPDTCFPQGAIDILEEFQGRAKNARERGAEQPVYPDETVEPELENSWTDTGKALFNNWLGQVYQLTSRDRLVQYMDHVDPDDPLDMKNQG